MPTLTISDPQLTMLRDLAEALVTQERYATRPPVFYQIRYETNEFLTIADRNFPRGEESTAKAFLDSLLKSEAAREALSALWYFEELAEFGPNHGIPVLHYTPHYRYHGCWLTHVEALAYLEQHRAKFRNPSIYVDHSVDPVLDTLLTWVASLTALPDAECSRNP